MPEFVVGMLLVILLATVVWPILPAVALIPPGANPLAYPAELAGQATSCEEEASRPIDRAELLVAFLAALETRYSSVLGGGSRSATLDAYRADSATLGRRVRVELAAGPALEGSASGVADDGRLMVVDDAGAQHLVSVGDVKHLRT